MKKTSIHQLILWPLAIISLGAAMTSISVLQSTSQSNYERLAENRARSLADVLGFYLDLMPGEEGTLARLVEALSVEEDVELLTIAMEGKQSPIASNKRAWLHTSLRQLPEKELGKSLRRSLQSNTTISPPPGDRSSTRDYVFPIRISDSLQLGQFVQVAIGIRLDTADMYATFYRQHLSLTVLFVTLIFISTYACYQLLHYYVLNPVKKLEESMTKPTDQSEAKHCPVLRLDEIGTVAQSYNTLLDKLEESRKIIEEQRDRLALAFEGTEDGLWDWKVPENISFISSRFNELMGLEPGTVDWTRTAWDSRVHPDDLQHVNDSLAKHIESDVPFDVEFRLLHASGEYRWFRSRGKAKRGPDGRAIRLAGAISDVHEKRTAHDRLEKALEDLQRSNLELEQFTYIASHDLRSPLVNIKGFSKEIELGTKEMAPLIAKAKKVLEKKDGDRLEKVFQEDVVDSLGYIFKSIDRMDLYTQSLLSLSKLSQKPSDTQTVDVEDVVQTILASHHHQLRQKEAEIRMDGLEPIVTDKLALYQILGNLLDNAVKYRDPDAALQIDVKMWKQEGRYYFRVSDTGLGITEGTQKQVFDIFRRGNHPDVEGSGMGLAVVRTLVRKLGGTIECESAEGEGTSFTFFVQDQSACEEAHGQGLS